jgi:hypothetical protein
MVYLYLSANILYSFNINFDDLINIVEFGFAYLFAMLI